MLRAGIKALNLELFVEEDVASFTITAIKPPVNITVDAIRKNLKEKFRILVADGQEELKGQIFRIGHMGYVFERDILMTLASLEAVLLDLGHKCQKGAAVTAALAIRFGSSLPKELVAPLAHRLCSFKEMGASLAAGETSVRYSNRLLARLRVEDEIEQLWKGGCLHVVETEMPIVAEFSVVDVGNYLA